MAISEPMSNHSNWMQFHQSYFSEINQTEVPPTTAAAATTTMISTDDNLSLDQGRISKPIRRRSRASRRTPTTLVNTDTTNFRAMVQQFTGGPHAAPTAGLQLPNAEGFGQHIGSTTAATVALASGFNVRYSNQLQQPLHMFMVNNVRSGGDGGGGVSSDAPPPGAASTDVNRIYNNYMV